MRVGSLFAGIGGFDLAAECVGMTVGWQSEIDPHASRVLDHHWPHIKNLGDIHGIEDASRVDVLTGGFPCQDYSVAGTRGGLAGDRGALWWEYHRLITGLRPTWVLGENVPGLLSSRGGADFETIVGSLTECGYGVAWAVLDAQYFGVAQRRRRVFIVGHSGGVPRPEILALSEGVYGHPEPRRETGEPAAAGVGAFAQNQRDEVRHLGDVAGGLQSEPEMKQQTYVAFSAGNHASSYGIGLSEQHTPPLRAGESGTNQVPTIAQPLRSNPHNNSDPLMEVSMHVYGKSAVRRLTPLECERLQGFPDGWTAIPGNSDTQRYRQLGNAVAVPVVEWILRNIAEAA